MRGLTRPTIGVLLLLAGVTQVLRAQSAAPMRNSALFAPVSGSPVHLALVADSGKQDRQAGGIFFGILGSGLVLALLSDPDGGLRPSALEALGVVAAGGLVGYLIESVRRPE